MTFVLTVAMRFTVAAAVLSVVASSSAMALTDRQDDATCIPCVQLDLPLIGPIDSCSIRVGTVCTGAAPVDLPLEASIGIISLAVGVSVYLPDTVEHNQTH